VGFIFFTSFSFPEGRVFSQGADLGGWGSIKEPGGWGPRGLSLSPRRHGPGG